MGVLLPSGVRECEHRLKRTPLNYEPQHSMGVLLASAVRECEHIDRRGLRETLNFNNARPWIETDPAKL